VIWFGPHAAHATVYVPFTIGMLHLPPSYSIGNPWKLSRRSAYWAHRYVQNLANLRWKDMIVDIRAARQELMHRSLVLPIDHVLHHMYEPRPMCRGVWCVSWGLMWLVSCVNQYYGLATTSRLLKIIGLFCRI